MLCNVVVFDIGKISMFRYYYLQAQLILLGVLLIAMANFLIGTFIPPTEVKFSKGYVGYRGKLHNVQGPVVFKTLLA